MPLMETVLSLPSRFRFSILKPTCFHVITGTFLEKPQSLNLASNCALLFAELATYIGA